MRRPVVRLLCAVSVLALLACGAWAASSGEALVTLRRLQEVFLPSAVSQGEERALGALQEAYDAARGDLDAVRQDAESGGGQALYRDVLEPQEWKEGDRITLSTGSGFLLAEGTVSVRHSGAVLDLTEGAEVPSGAVLAGNHRYLAAEDTEAVLTVLSGGARLAVQGNYTPASGSSEALPFYDVAQGDWFRDAVRVVCGKGFFSGEDEHHFNPGGAMDRAMLMAVLYRIAGSPQEELEAAAQVQYADVPDTVWYAPYVRWGGAQGITAGTGQNTFGPGQEISREQVVTLLHSFAVNYLGRSQDAGADLSGYRDLEQVSPWAAESLSWAVAQGILSSASSDVLTLSPRGGATRAQMAVMLRAFAEKLG